MLLDIDELQVALIVRALKSNHPRPQCFIVDGRAGDCWVKICSTNEHYVSDDLRSYSRNCTKPVFDSIELPPTDLDNWELDPELILKCRLAQLQVC